MRQAVRPLAVASCIVLIAVVSARAQPVPAAPRRFEVLPRFDFRISANALTSDDPRFTWDTHWAGDFDLVDYSYGRLTFLADYQAILGEQLQPFDPYQSQYHLEMSTSLRQGSNEWALAFHHVSRHRGDRPLPQAVAWNTLLWRIQKRIERQGTTLDFKGDIGPAVAKAWVDYTWRGNADVVARRPISPAVDVYARALGDTIGVDEDIAGRGQQWGGRLEAGVRFTGRAGAIEVFGGFERMIDADPLDRTTRQWLIGGFRLSGI